MKRPWLTPFVPLYAAGAALHNLRLKNTPPRRLRWPVVSIGNLSTGGAGKTPLTIALAQLLTAHGIHVDVLSRGYGRRSTLPTRVEINGTAERFGDEPLLIARATSVPVYVAPQRYDAGLLAESDADNTQSTGQHNLHESHISSAHILDDGFQHRQLFRDIDILLLNRADWHDTLFPAGNLREALHAAKRADVFAIPADDTAFEADLRTWGWTGPIWRLHRRMEIPAVDGPVLAFCGIARPEQFFTGLEAAGIQIANRMAFRDHFGYRPADLNDLIDTATLPHSHITALVTTEKDLIRLGPLASTFPPDLPLKTARLTIEIEDATAAIDWLLSRLSEAQPPPAL